MLELSDKESKITMIHMLKAPMKKAESMRGQMSSVSSKMGSQKEN